MAERYTRSEAYTQEKNKEIEPIVQSIAEYKRFTHIDTLGIPKSIIVDTMESVYLTNPNRSYEKLADCKTWRIWKKQPEEHFFLPRILRGTFIDVLKNIKDSSLAKDDETMISKIDAVITHDEQYEELLHAFISKNEPLIFSEISKIPPEVKRNICNDELYTAGYIGFVHAIELFDPKKEYCWTTYIFSAVHQEMTEYCRKTCEDRESPYNVPYGAGEQLSRLNYLARELGMSIAQMSVNDIARLLGIGSLRARSLRQIYHDKHTVSFDEPIDKGSLVDSQTVQSIVADSRISVADEVYTRLRRQELLDIIELIKEPFATACRVRYGIFLNKKEITQVRKIEKGRKGRYSETAELSYGYHQQDCALEVIAQFLYDTGKTPGVLSRERVNQIIKEAQRQLKRQSQRRGKNSFAEW